MQRPHPPITIGGRGPNRTLRAVARWAQQWNVILVNPAEFRELKEILLTRCAEVGRDPAQITCSTNVRVDPGEGMQAAADQAAAFGEAGADLVIMNLPLRAKPDMLGDLADALRPLA